MAIVRVLVMAWELTDNFASDMVLCYRIATVLIRTATVV